MLRQGRKNNFMKKSFLGKVLMMASFVAILGGFSSCQDYTEEVKSELLNKLEIQNTTLEQALEAQKQALEAKIAELQAAQEACKAECAEKMSQLEAKWNAELAAQVALLKAEDAKLAEQIAAISGVIGDVAALEGKTIVEQIVALNKVAAAVNDTIVAWGPRLTAVEQEAAAAKNQADVNKAAIENLDSIAKAHDEEIDALTQELKDSVAAIQAQAAANLEAAQKYADDQIAVMMGNVSDSLAEVKEEILGSIANVQNDLLDSLSSVNAAMLDSVSQLAEAMALTDAVLAERLDSVEARVAVLEEQVAENKQAIENLTGALKKLVTSVVLQGTKNPVMGSIATPFNTRSNILAAYYGSVDAQGLEFPTARPRFFVDAANVQMTAKDVQMLGVEAVTKEEGIVLLGDEGNAGTVYMTINPNTVDFTGLSVALVNSQDEFSGAELSSLAPSDEVLSFGYTRAAKNGFYEAKATVTEESLEDVKLSMNFNEIKEVAKDLVNGGGVNVSAIASTVANAMSTFVMDANGVKVSWTDELCDEEHSVYSQYGVAVTAVKPLSYAFGSDFAFTNVPGMDRIESLIGKLSEKAKAAINKTDKVLNYELVEIKEITIPETPVVDSIAVVVDIPGKWATVENSIDSVWVEGYNDTIYVSVQDVVDELYGNLAGSFTDVNEMLKGVKDMVDEINEVLAKAKNLKASTLNGVDKFQSKMTSFLDIFNDKFCAVINSTNKVLRPILFVTTEDGFHKLSQAKNNPTVITGKTLSLIPTSYSLEYIAPAYKKLVGVTNVFKGSASAQAGDADCVAALNKVNEQAAVAEVLAGDTYEVEATFEAGYVYEVVYTAVDFYGKVDAKKFYVTVK